MSIFIILFFLLRLSTAQHDCTPTTCSDHGPTIRFPFRLKNHHPHHCGYPGFDLTCSPNATHLPTTTTVLDLPNSVKVLVTKIDYKSRLIHIKDPNSCFPQHLQNLNLSATPFEFADFVFADSVSNFSLFSCPPNWVCGKCEAKGKFCRFKSNSTSDEIECFGKLNPLKKDEKSVRERERRRGTKTNHPTPSTTTTSDPTPSSTTSDSTTTANRRRPTTQPFNRRFQIC